MSLKHREDSIAGIRLREAQRTKIAISAELLNGSIVLEMPEGGVCTGTMVKFSAPCSCDKVTGGIIIDDVTYTVVDAMGECVTGVGGVWDVGAQIAVIIDQENEYACIQNAATKGILDSLNDHIKNKNNPHEVKANQVEVGEEVEEALDLDSGANTAAALLAMNSLKCSMASGSYVGNKDAENGFDISFPFRPKFIACTPDDVNGQAWMYAGGRYVNFAGAKSNYTGFDIRPISFNGNTATISPYDGNNDCTSLCRNGVTYHWVAFG